jgi:hypothetical protein
MMRHLEGPSAVAQAYNANYLCGRDWEDHFSRTVSPDKMFVPWCTPVLPIPTTGKHK